MKNIAFLSSLDDFKVDTLLVCDPALQSRLDRQLGGAVEYNIRRFGFPAVMTTNGKFPIPKLIFTDQDRCPLLDGEINVGIAMQNSEPAKLAYKILLEYPNIQQLFILCENPKEAEPSFQRYQALLDGVALAKKIIQAPSNQMTPGRVAEHCLELRSQGIEVTVFDHNKLQLMGAEALLAVGKGSPHAPKMILMEYRGSSEAPIALVGKGICYDSGGINLKQSHLLEMKWDKAGAGAVIGVMEVLSKLRPEVHVVGCIVLAENMPDGNSVKPGDVISSLKGLSIEVVDTDCEGRLALADGIAYVQQAYNPKTVIDLGTLTLETFGALGAEYAGLFCNDPNLQKALVDAGDSSEEKLWPLPLGEYYARQLRSPCADLKNVGVFRYGGSSAAAEFLNAFVKPGVAWAHIDIAGTAWKLDAPEEGVSAFGVKFLVEYLLSI